MRVLISDNLLCSTDQIFIESGDCDIKNCFYFSFSLNGGSYYYFRFENEAMAKIEKPYTELLRKVMTTGYLDIIGEDLVDCSVS